MRRIAWGLLLVFAFAIPWEYSLDLGEPLGNVARIVGLLLLMAAIPAVLQARSLRTPGPLQWLVLVFFLWFCCTSFWTIDTVTTVEKMRAYFQEMMIVWLVWEFAEGALDLRALLRAFVAGSWVLALLTLANFTSAATIAAEQVRFAATGQDPNDVARFLDIGFPLAALLVNSESRWQGRLLALGYLPLGLVAVLLTASRGGFLAAIVAMTGCALLLARGRTKGVVAVGLALPATAAALWVVVPQEIFERLATIPEQLQTGDLNQRLNIWTVGWQAFVQAPIFGSGAGSFASAAGLGPIDTAHNTVLAILVTGGLIGLFLAAAIVVLVMRSVVQTRGAVRYSFALALLVWMMTSLVATVEESRTTWFLFALIAVAARLAEEEPESLSLRFPDGNRSVALSESPARAL